MQIENTDVVTIKTLFKNRPNIIIQGQSIIQAYMERNTTFQMQKAIALNIFSVALLEGD